jgi:hypothetical protein
VRLDRFFFFFPQGKERYMKYQAILQLTNWHVAPKPYLYAVFSGLEKKEELSKAPSQRDLLINNFFGGHKAVVRPDPIPNSAVKRSLANGSGCIASARVGRRQIFPSQNGKP